MFKSLVLSSGVKCTLFIFAFTKENQLKSKSHIRRIAIKHDWNNSMTQSIPKRSFDCTEFLRGGTISLMPNSQMTADCESTFTHSHLHHRAQRLWGGGMSRQSLFSMASFYGFHLWYDVQTESVRTEEVRANKGTEERGWGIAGRRLREFLSLTSES